MNISTFSHYLLDVIFPGVKDTLVILIFTMLITGTIGFVLGSILYMTDKNSLKPNIKVHFILGIVINTIRSIPSVIFMIFLIPFARLVIGEAIGRRAAIFYLSIMCSAFVARIVDDKLKRIDKPLINAAVSMGIPEMIIWWRIVVHEAIPLLVLGYSFAIIMIMGTIAVAGLIGAGGIGTIALNYGYYSFNKYVMYGSVIVIFIITFIVQIIGRALYEKLK